VKVTLQFERAGAIDITFSVVDGRREAQNERHGDSHHQ